MARLSTNACSLRSSGTSADAEPDSFAGRADADRLAVDDDLTAVVLVGAEDGARDLRAARTDQPRQPDDLAGADAER